MRFSYLENIKNKINVCKMISDEKGKICLILYFMSALIIFVTLNIYQEYVIKFWNLILSEIGFLFAFPGCIILVSLLLMLCICWVEYSIKRTLKTILSSVIVIICCVILRTEENSEVTIIFQLLAFVISFFVYRHAHSKECRKPETKPIDLLYRLPFYNQLIDEIRSFSKKSLAVAIYGEWGCGKTHFIKHLKSCLSIKEIDEKKQFGYVGEYSIGEVSLWRYDSKDAAWNGIANALIEAITGKKRIPRGKIMGLFIELLKCFHASSISLYEKVLDFLDNKSTQEEICKFLSEKIEKTGRRALLIIEDIDRTSMEIVNHLWATVEVLKKIEGLTVVCTIADKELYQKCLDNSEIGNNSHNYLIKIFDIFFSIPAMSSFGQQYMVEKELKNTQLGKELKRFIYDNHVHFQTPRQLQIVLKKLQSVEQQYRNSKQRKTGNISCVFLVEILRMLYPAILNEIILANGIESYKKDYKSDLYRNSLWKDRINMPYMFDDLYGKDKDGIKWETSYPESAMLVKNDVLAWSALTYLCYISNNDDFYYAYSLSYLRNEIFTKEEIEKIMNLYTDKLDIDDAIKEVRKGKGAIEDISGSIMELLEYPLKEFTCENEAFLRKLVDEYVTKNSECGLENDTFRVIDYITSDRFVFRLFEQYLLRKENDINCQFAYILGRIASCFDFSKVVTLCYQVLLVYMRTDLTVLKYTLSYNGMGRNMEEVDVENKKQSEPYMTLMTELLYAYHRCLMDELSSKYASGRISDQSNYKYYTIFDMCKDEDLQKKIEDKIQEYEVSSDINQFDFIKNILLFVDVKGYMDKGSTRAYTLISDFRFKVIERFLNACEYGGFASNELRELRALCEQIRADLGDGVSNYKKSLKEDNDMKDFFICGSNKAMKKLNKMKDKIDEIFQERMS